MIKSALRVAALATAMSVVAFVAHAKNPTVGGAAMINGHIDIADNVHVTAGTLVPNSITVPGRYTGFYPMAPNAEWERNAALLRNLSAMREKIKAIERTLKALGAEQAARAG